MIKIERNGSGGFRMTFSAPGTGWRGYHVMANNLREVHAAIDHHIGEEMRSPHQPPKRRLRHCPLCRRMREEERNRANKKKPAPRRTG